MTQGILDFYSLTRLEDFEYYASMSDYETGNGRLLDGWSLLLASIRQLCLIVTLSVVRLVGHLSASQGTEGTPRGVTRKWTRHCQTHFGIAA